MPALLSALHAPGRYRITMARQHDVRWLKIAVNDSLLVRVPQALRLFPFEALAFDVLHDNETVSLRFRDFVDIASALVGIAGTR